MIGKAVVTTAITVAAITGAGVLPASANIGGDDPRDCTRVEFRAIERGMKWTRVERIVESRGTIDAHFEGQNGHFYVFKTYGKGYTGNGWCMVTYRDGHVSDKQYVP